MSNQFAGINHEQAGVLFEKLYNEFGDPFAQEAMDTQNRAPKTRAIQAGLVASGLVLSSLFAANLATNENPSHPNAMSASPSPSHDKFVLLPTTNVVSEDLSLTAPKIEITPQDTKDAKDCLPEVDKIHFFHYDKGTKGNNFGPAVGAETPEAGVTKILNDTCVDPVLLTDHMEFLGFYNLDPATRVTKVQEYMKNPELWKVDHDKLVKFMESAKEISVEKFSGTYLTGYQTNDKNGDKAPELVKGYENSVVDQRVYKIVDKDGKTHMFKDGCHLQDVTPLPKETRVRVPEQPAPEKKETVVVQPAPASQPNINIHNEANATAVNNNKNDVNVNVEKEKEKEKEKKPTPQPKPSPTTPTPIPTPTHTPPPPSPTPPPPSPIPTPTHTPPPPSPSPTGSPLPSPSPSQESKHDPNDHPPGDPTVPADKDHGKPDKPGNGPAGQTPDQNGYVPGEDKPATPPKDPETQPTQQPSPEPQPTQQPTKENTPPPTDPNAPSGSPENPVTTSNEDQPQAPRAPAEQGSGSTPPPQNDSSPNTAPPPPPAESN